MKETITRKQIGVIYRAMKNYQLEYDKKTVAFLYDEVADHEFEVDPEKNERDYIIYRTIKGIVDSFKDPDGYWSYWECNKRLKCLMGYLDGKQFVSECIEDWRKTK